MLYPEMNVPGKVNGGLHEILTFETPIKEYAKFTTDAKGPLE